MRDQPQFDVLVRMLYEAAVNPVRMEDALGQLATCCGADNIHLMAWDPTLAQPTFSLAPGMDEGIEAQYRSYYGALDPRRLLVARGASGDWIACHHHFDAVAVERSEFFQDYLIPGGCRYLLGTRLVHHAQHDVFLGMHRAPGRRPFDEAQFGFVRWATAYLQHAMRIWLDTEDLRNRAELGWGAIDAAGMAVLGTNEAGHIYWANAYAQALLREATVVACTRGRLTTASPSGAEKLSVALRHAVAKGVGQSLRLDASDSAMRQGCVAVVVPLGLDSALEQRLRPAPLMVLLRHTTHNRSPTVAQIMDVLNLSPAEASIAQAIAAGKTLETCAEEGQVTVNTVKRQLQNVFAKTGLARQVDLALRVSSIPVVRGRRQKIGSGEAPRTGT